MPPFNEIMEIPAIENFTEWQDQRVQDMDDAVAKMLGKHTGDKYEWNSSYYLWLMEMSDPGTLASLGLTQAPKDPGTLDSSRSPDVR